MTSPHVALTIAGSDSSAGAGLQADLKTFAAHGVHGLTVVTSVVAERPGQVISLVLVSPESVGQQLDAVLPFYPVAALKTGLLPSAAIIEIVLDRLRHSDAPLVVDPVMFASAGNRLASSDAKSALLQLIRDRATLVTPNRAEAEMFLGESIASPAEASIRLSEWLGCAVLLKGGHFEGTEAIDWLATGNEVIEFSGPRLAALDVHGTGCTYSAAIAAQLALGLPLPGAVHQAKQYLQRALEHHWEWTDPQGQRIKALAHFPEP